MAGGCAIIGGGCGTNVGCGAMKTGVRLAPVPNGGGMPTGANCIKIGLPGKSILRDYFQEIPFLLMRISFHFSGKTFFYTTRPCSMCVNWRQLYKNKSSRKIDSQRLFSREYVCGKTFSLTENQFSGKTYFYTIHPCRSPTGLPSMPSS